MLMYFMVYVCFLVRWIDPNATPVVHSPRRIPVALEEKVKQQLQSMVDDDIITKVTTPTDWVNSMVVVEKPNSNSVRIC